MIFYDFLGTDKGSLPRYKQLKTILSFGVLKHDQSGKQKMTLKSFKDTSEGQHITKANKMMNEETKRKLRKMNLNEVIQMIE